ncbi:GTPase HflX [Candidatus Borkfalkia ceftriaxoniphila]|uniref:GTPase HflX n=1 Tax=Candidatus Borkfalkia ceftriaxoniphila TaxID=2508949 RepID=A0A4Q2K4L8_9FIRM|nr:GTPase HflX [Candidatus Borkfalkia ceftriaxoniphila]RXZ57922.1 GTPase HflX [Candidatus Borkfalkia ceftriaxoniphila]
MEKVYVIQPIIDEDYRIEHEEIISLIESSDGVYAGTLYQKIREVNPATYIGEGKLSELKERLSGLDEITVLFNGALSPSQTLNISHVLDDRKVIDRTTLILDIFAKNAKSSEGKLQVELAQLKYMYPRLKGKGEALSRLGGGIGTRGPGESQLETDRRHIRRRIDYLESKLKNIETRRYLLSERRKKNAVKTIALVGYTNTGKSTLLNLLTQSDVFVKDQLFATLDPTSRKMEIDDVEFMLIDTVGFLKNLPHDLIDAFHSTLESALNCDLALIVCDATGEYEMQLKTTLDTLDALHFNAPYIVVMNKSETLRDFEGYPTDAVFISAKENLGTEVLKREILKRFQNDYVFCSLRVPYRSVSDYNANKKYLKERNIIFNDFGMLIDAVIPAMYISKFHDFIDR